MLGDRPLHLAPRLRVLTPYSSQHAIELNKWEAEMTRKKAEEARQIIEKRKIRSVNHPCHHPSLSS